VWSFGLTMLAVAVGRYPIDCPGGASFWVLLNYLQEESVPLPPEGVFSPAFRDFIAQCLHKDPSELPISVDRRRASRQREEKARCLRCSARCLLRASNSYRRGAQVVSAPRFTHRESVSAELHVNACPRFPFSLLYSPRCR